MITRALTRVAVLLSLLAMSACTQVDNTTATNLAASDRITAEVWNSGNFAMMAEVVAENFVRHNPASWDPPVIDGRQAFEDYVKQVRTDFADFNVQIHNRIADGNMVAANWTVSGTHNESGNQISVDGLTLSRYVEGKLVEEWVSWDTHLVMQQMGMVGEATTMK